MKRIKLTILASFILINLLSGAISTNAPSQIGKYKVFEITITHSESPYSNVWDIMPTVVFTSPTGANINVDGFYYDTDTWKVRFAPWEKGTYTWTLTLGSDADNGSFTCIPSNEKGFVRINPSNPYRFIYESDSSLFTAHGFGSCLGNNPIDPKEYNDGSGKYYYYIDDIGDYSMDEYLDEMADVTGFNLYRWSSPNCSWALWDTISASKNVYSKIRGHWGDDLIKGFRERGIRFLVDPLGFGWQESFSSTVNLNDPAPIKKYYRYVIARYGAYLDIFELINEYPVSDTWITDMVTYIKSIDPYKHIITTSWANPSHSMIEMNSRHEYPNMNLYTTDTDMISLIEDGANGKYAHAKPIMFDEIGTGSVWAPITFPDTTRRPSVRVRTWVSFFNEAHNVYWEFNSRPNLGGGLYMDPNIRRDFGIFNNFTSVIPSDIVMDATSTVTGGAYGSRVYGLKNSTDLYLYVFAPSLGSFPPVTSNASVDIVVPADGIAYWFNTSDGSIISSVPVTSGATTLNVPPFTLDIALKVLGGVQLDTQAPSVPTGLTTSNIGEASVDLSWNASTDNVGVVNYLVYLDGVYEQTVLDTNTRITGLDPETTYSFTVSARDNAVNESLQSAAAGATTTVAKYYTLIVNSGSGDGSYRKGTVLTINADAPPAGESFNFWSGYNHSIVDGNLSTSLFTMPGENTSITATYTGSSLGLYNLTVNNGTGSESYTESSTITITAEEAPAGQVFDIWTGDIANIADVNSSTTTINMPGSDAIVTATFKNISGTNYNLTVNNGTGSGNYTESTVINIVADAAPAGQFFSAWTGDIANITDVNAASTSITMPASATAITATYVSATTYTLTVTNGTGSGDYSATTIVNITADTPPAGQVFDVWTGDVSNVADINAESTSITMPASASSVTATYKALPAGYRYLKYTVTGASNLKIIEISWLVGTNEYPATDLTSANSGGVVVSGSYGIYSYRAFNGIATDGDGLWVGSNTPQDIILDLVSTTIMPTAINIQKMSWNDLQSFRCDGSNDGTNWTLLLDHSPADINWTDQTFPISSDPTSYLLTINNGSGSGNYTESTVVNISADVAPAGEEFDVWTGDVVNIADVNSESTTITMPASATAITATYKALPPTTYTLTVNSGSGDGDYTASTLVNITADAAPTGEEFDVWIGDVANISDVNSESTTITMPASATAITATYRIISCNTPSTVDICIVGVDNVSGKNIIQWDPATVSNASIINIYKETDIADDYIITGTTNVIDGSYIDNGSDPEVQANRYKLSAENTCGDESVLSPEHKTIHLSINQGVGSDWNLIWDAYIGFNIDTYTIYRGTDIENLLPLNTIAGNLNSYTDKTAPAGTVYYQIEVINSVGCGNKKAAASSKSNIAEANSITKLRDIYSSEILVYPNPSSDIINIKNLNNVNEIRVMDLLSRTLIIESNIGSGNHEINVSDLESGHYYIMIIKNKDKEVLPLIVK